MTDKNKSLMQSINDYLEAAREDKTVPPPPDFDEDTYLRDNPDVAHAVRVGDVPSGFIHFHFYGRHEGRVRPTRAEHHRR